MKEEHITYEITSILIASSSEDAPYRFGQQDFRIPHSTPNPTPTQMNQAQLNLFDYFFGSYVYFPESSQASRTQPQPQPQKQEHQPTVSAPAKLPWWKQGQYE